MWQDHHSATWCSPTVQAVYSKHAENVSVGKTQRYWANHRSAELRTRVEDVSAKFAVSTVECPELARALH